MLDPNSLSRMRIGPACDIAGGKDAGDARLKILVDDDTAVDRESGLLGKLNRRPDTDADDNEIRSQSLAGLQRDARLIDRHRRGAEVKVHIVFFVDRADEAADLLP